MQQHKIHILHTTLKKPQHYKIFLSINEPTINTLTRSTSIFSSTDADTDTLQSTNIWTEVSETSRAPIFSKEGYDINVPTQDSDSTPSLINLTIYGNDSRKGNYTVIGATSFPTTVDVLNIPIPLSIYQHHSNIHPSDFFTSLYTVIQHQTTLEAFRAYLGRKKPIARDLDLHIKMTSCSRLTGALLKKELFQTAKQFEIEIGNTADTKIDVTVLRSTLEGCAEQARTRLATPFQQFIKKKSKKLIKSLEKIQKKKLKKKKKTTTPEELPTTYSLTTKVGEIIVRLAPISKPSVEELLQAEGMSLEEDEEEVENEQQKMDTSISAQTTSTSNTNSNATRKHSGNGRIYVTIHGLQSVALESKRLRLEGRVVPTSADTLLRTKSRVSKGRGYSKLMRRVLEVVHKIPTNHCEIRPTPTNNTTTTTHLSNLSISNSPTTTQIPTQPSTQTTSTASRPLLFKLSSSSSPSTFLSVPYDEYDSNSDAMLRLDVIDDSDREDLWPSRGGVSVPLRRLLPDVQYDLIVTFKKNSQLDRISLSILLTQTKEERRRHADECRGNIRPEIIQLHLSSLLGPVQNELLQQYRRLIGIVSLLDDTQVRQFHTYKRKNTIGGGDADHPPFLTITVDELLTGENELLHQYPNKCEHLMDMRASTILLTNTKPSSIPSTQPIESNALPWETTLSFPLSSDNNCTKACIELYCDDTGIGADLQPLNILPSVSLGYFMLDITEMKTRTDGGVISISSLNNIVLDQPINDAVLSSLKLTAYGRMWCGESYGAVVPKYMNPAYVMKCRRSSKNSITSEKKMNHTNNITNTNSSSIVNEEGSRPSSVEEAIRQEKHRVSSSTKNINAFIGTTTTKNTVAIDSGITSPSTTTITTKRKKSLYSYETQNNVTDVNNNATKVTNATKATIKPPKQPNPLYESYPTSVDLPTTQSVSILQAHLRGWLAREKIVELLLVDRRLRTLKKRASAELSGLEDIHAMKSTLKKSKLHLKQSIQVRNESVRKMREADTERTAALEMMETMQKEMDEALSRATKSEERLKSAEETIIGCDEMLVERDKKIARLEAEVRSLKYDTTSKRSPPLKRGQGGGGGAGTLSSTNQKPSELEQELETKKIQIERLSAKLEQSEEIINRMIQASAGGGGGGGRGEQVPHTMRGGRGKGRRGGGRRYMNSEYADY